MIYFKLKLRQDFQTGILDKFSTKRANYELINQTISEQVDALQAMPEETRENIKNLVVAYQNVLRISCDRNLPKVKIGDK